MIQDSLSLDHDTRTALEAFRARILNRFGGKLRGLVLFGSGARGDHRPDSDADVAVFLEAVDDPVAAQMELQKTATRYFSAMNCLFNRGYSSVHRSILTAPARHIYWMRSRRRG
jgi:predicted nucleotidyltransferase